MYGPRRPPRNFHRPQDPLGGKYGDLLDPIVKTDDAKALEMLLCSVMEYEGYDIKLTEYQSVDRYRQINALQRCAHDQAEKCVELLVNPPLSWNVDAYDYKGYNAVLLAELQMDPKIMRQLAPHSKLLRPYPADFWVTRGENFVQYLQVYLFWPNLALFGQPRRMLPNIEENLGRNSHHKATIVVSAFPRINIYVTIDSAGYSLLYELLLANAELCNYDVTGDGRIPYDDIINIDCGRLWPIKPVNADLVLDHIDCKNFPSCLQQIHHEEIPSENKYRDLFIRWKIHRFGQRTDGGLGFTFKPPALKEFGRFVIRRLMVRRTEPFAIETEHYMFPNQMILIRTLPISDKLKAYMTYPDCKASTQGSLTYGPRKAFHQVKLTEVPLYGKGMEFDDAFLPDDFEKFYPLKI